MEPDLLSFCGELIDKSGIDQFEHLANKYNGKHIRICVEFME